MQDARPPFPLRLWHWTTARVLYTSAIIILILYLVRAARETFTLFLFAILFAYFLAPLVNRLEKPLRSRIAAIGAVYLLLAGVITGLIFLLAPTLSEQTRDLAVKLPELLNRASSGELLQAFAQKHHWPADRVNAIQSILQNHSDALSTIGADIGRSLAKPATHIWWLLLIPILAIFFLKDGEKIAANIGGIASDPEDRILINGLTADVNVMLGSYIRSQMILALLTLVAYSLVLSVLRVPYALILGPLAGFLEFIPVVGPAIAALCALLIPALAGYSHMLLLLAFIAIWRLLQDYVNAPRIMGKSLEINPLLQIFAVLAGGEIAGVVGALVSVPVAAILRIIWRRMHQNSRDQSSTSYRQSSIAQPAASD
ncbi:AI-2E family transporter [Occallatibacter savannae]|uniref:AI-2E family transporter n=1 Tax=Occallatibacter savannae TaxID=1002691 RepID=UPI000D69D5FB|nr:AI-2E family transporter [Occallatibacter savannae]